MRRALPVLVLATALAACGGAGDSPSASAPSDAVPSRTVEIDDFAYDPEEIEVAVGTTVTWSNEDATRHTVTAGREDDPDPDTFDLDVDEQGQTVDATFEEPGSYAYFCELHPFMTGTVVVR